jgi:hypothetical protein
MWEGHAIWCKLQGWSELGTGIKHNRREERASESDAGGQYTRWWEGGIIPFQYIYFLVEINGD